MRPATAIIDLYALENNYLLAKKISNSKVLAVVKADAYGHGAVQCAKYLADVADGFAVACIEEAIILRKAGISNPILLLEGFFNLEELKLIAILKLWIVVHSNWQIDMLAKADLKEQLNVWLKVDIGMHRLGIAPDDYVTSYRKITNLKCVKNVVLMGHLSCADEPSNNNNKMQIECFKQATHNLPNFISLKNSAAILTLDNKVKSDWVRPGIMLYGVNPVVNNLTRLQAVMTLRSDVIGVINVKRGEAVGYGATFIAPYDMKIGTVALGYADGYPRQVVTGTQVMVEGASSIIIGRISMDMINIDLTHIPQAGIGSKVEFWGKNIKVNDIATRANTMAYQILCNVKRVNKKYTK